MAFHRVLKRLSARATLRQFITNEKNKRSDVNRILNHRNILVCATLAVLAFVWLGLMELGLAPSPLATSTNTVTKLNNVAGHDYEVTYTNSDTLAKNEWISVYVSKPRTSFIPYWPHKKTLLFRYDPAASRNAPSIEALNGHTVKISIPEVSSVFRKRTEWDGLTVEYQIGRVDYP